MRFLVFRLIFFSTTADTLKLILHMVLSSVSEQVISSKNISFQMGKGTVVRCFFVLCLWWVLLRQTVFLFFAAYVICRKNYSFSRVVYFFRPNLPILFNRKLMITVGLGQQGSQTLRLGLESLSCQMFLWFIPNIFGCPKTVTHWSVLLANFCHCDTKIVRQKTLTIPPPLYP